MPQTSLDKDKIRFLLLEGVHQSALENLKANGYTNIDYLKTALPNEELKERIKDAHFVGLRSRTQLTEEVFDAAEKLIGVGCFCIGTRWTWTPPWYAVFPCSTHLTPIRAPSRSWWLQKRLCCIAAFPPRTLAHMPVTG